ncbi:uncharacterized protein [Dendrobates tinctorius]
MIHKKRMLKKIKRGLMRNFGIQRTTTQIRKKLVDLRYLSSQRIATIRSENQRGEGPPSPSSPPSLAAPPTAPASPGDHEGSPPTPSPAASPSPASLHDIGAGSPSAVGGTGSGWAISPSPEGTEPPQYQIPTAQALLASHRRMRAAMAVTLAAMDVHGVMLERFLAGLQEGGSPQ